MDQTTKLRIAAKLAMTRHAGLRPTIELAIFPRLYMQVVYSIACDRDATGDERAFYDAVTPGLRLGIASVIPAGKVPVDALFAVTRHLLHPYADRSRIFVTAVITHAATAMEAEGMIEIPEGGPLADALDRILSECNAHPDIVEGIDRSARKAAPKLIAAMRALGLFRKPSP